MAKPKHLNVHPELYLIRGRIPTACGHWVRPKATTKYQKYVTCKLCIYGIVSRRQRRRRELRKARS